MSSNNKKITTIETNIHCEGCFGLNVFQPKLQSISGSHMIKNPYYDTCNNITYFTYGILYSCTTNKSNCCTPPCTSATSCTTVSEDIGNITAFYISISDTIPFSNIINVCEQVDIFPEFTQVKFLCSNCLYELPPPSYKYLKICVNESLIPGSSAVFRIAFKGKLIPQVIVNSGISAFIIETTKRTSCLCTTQIQTTKKYARFSASPFDPFVFPNYPSFKNIF